MIEDLTYFTNASEPLYSNPSPLGRAKQLALIDAPCRNIIARPSLVVVGSVHPERGMDVSARGDGRVLSVSPTSTTRPSPIGGCIR